MAESDLCDTLPVPTEHLAAEHFRRLELGFSTLREQCLSVDPDKVDSEVGARFVQLYELWCWGYPIESSDAAMPVRDRLRNSSAARIAGLCLVMLGRVADDKFSEGVAGAQ